MPSSSISLILSSPTSRILPDKVFALPSRMFGSGKPPHLGVKLLLRLDHFPEGILLCQYEAKLLCVFLLWKSALQQRFVSFRSSLSLHPSWIVCVSVRVRKNSSPAVLTIY